ncbi:MAG: FKBP-type peptidyl-prolyl cis-trans isomerase [Cyclobacteriaceae bacterium]|nr:FKBP-type peptidyl-prolyl cis-trans isomerase [Cyclobacteriaceae bacterium]
MRLLKLISFLLLTILAACFPDVISFEEQLERDVELIDAYLAENNIEAMEDESGIRYVIHAFGSGIQPFPEEDCVELNYVGKVMATGNVFDERENFAYPLRNMLVGLQIGIPFIAKGGSLTLYIPSVYCFGSYGDKGLNVPKNANLIFDIDLLDVNSPNPDTGLCN